MISPEELSFAIPTLHPIQEKLNVTGPLSRKWMEFDNYKFEKKEKVKTVKLSEWVLK